MKKTLLTLFASIAIFCASAQINKGAVLLGASSALGINSVNPNNGSSVSVVNLDLKGGYFIVENFALGLNFQYLKVSSDNSSSSGSTIGLFGRYYIKGKVFVGAGINSTSSGSGSSSTSVPLEVGYAAFITPNIAIEPSFNFVKGDGSDTIGLNLGFTLYLNRD